MDTVQVSYGQYIFSPNPAAVTVKNRRTAVTEPLPGGGEWLTVTGTAPREVTLEGQLWAEDATAALRRYEELRKVYEAGGTQVLCVPGHPPFYALFTALTLEAQGDGRVLNYAAQFLEGGELL